MVAVPESRLRLPGDLVGLVRVAQEAVQLLDEQDALLEELAALLGTVERLAERLVTAGAGDWRLDHLHHDLTAALNDIDHMRGRMASRRALLGARR